MPCRAHAVPLPCRAALIHTCHAAPLPFSDSAVSFVKVRVVAGNNPNCQSYSLTDWYASDNNLRGTPRGSRKKPNAGRSPICRLWTADANSHMPCPCRAVPWPSEVAFRTAWSCHGTGASWAHYGMCESNTAALCKSNGKDNRNPWRNGMAGKRHGRGMGTAWCVCELA
jgi:hypothetical protein